MTLKIDFFYELIILQGVSWPAVQQLSAQWIPPNERSKFVSSYMGSSIGLFLFYPLFGFVIQWTYCWQSVFYLTAIFGIIWYFCWQYFVYDSPNLHPRISVAEKEYIMTSICSSAKHLSQVTFFVYFTLSIIDNKNLHNIYTSPGSNTMETNFTFSTRMDDCNRTIWFIVDNFNAYDTIANIFETKLQLEHSINGNIIGIATFI